jgi:succinate dehydrogenase/fumarate reductase flavoprotein subunit
VDKGYCGTSGASAPSGNSLWYIKPDPELRKQAMASREALGGFLAQRTWMERVLDQTFENINRVAEWGYPFPVDEHGESRRESIQGSEYMRLMRKKIQRAGVQILDQSPALELLVDCEGRVAGAAGINRQTGERWSIRAGAVVLATGGCAFLANGLGCNVLTGDGYLMAAEAGAEFSGMEFSSAYALSTTFGSVTKGRFFQWATFYYADGTPIAGAAGHHGRSIVAKTLLEQPVYDCIDQNVTPEIQAWMWKAQPNFFLPLNRRGIDPFTQHFPVTLRLEGTVRGTGGLRILNETCATSVLGLYAAGDAATRELICGGFTGGGSHNAAWAISSGYWSGQAAADYAKSLGTHAHQRSVQAIGEVGLRGDGAKAFSAEDTIAATQAEVFPYDRNLFRTGDGLRDSLGRLDSLWRDMRQSGGATGTQMVRSREAAAMVATARWMYRSGLQRTETRGMHKRLDYPEQDPNQKHYWLSGGLDQVWVKSSLNADHNTVTNKELVLR